VSGTVGEVPYRGPGLILYTDTHYSFFVENVADRAIPAQSAAPTESESAARYATFNASAGECEVTGSTVVRRPLVARDPARVGVETRAEFSVDGDQLTEVQADLDVRLVWRKVG
jgi:hypothetical protein